MPDTLRRAGMQAEAHDDHFPPDTPDGVWLSAVGKRGWIVITKDKAIRHRASELQALRDARVSAFVVTAKGLKGDEIGAMLVRVRDKLQRFVLGNPRPFIATVTGAGRIKMLWRGHRPRQRKKRARRAK